MIVVICCSLLNSSMASSCTICPNLLNISFTNASESKLFFPLETLKPSVYSSSEIHYYNFYLLILETWNRWKYFCALLTHSLALFPLKRGKSILGRFKGQVFLVCWYPPSCAPEFVVLAPAGDYPCMY